MQQRVCLHGFLAAADVDVSDFCWLFYDQAVEEFFYIGLSSICFISCLDQEICYPNINQRSFLKLKFCLNSCLKSCKLYSNEKERIDNSHSR